MALKVNSDIALTGSLTVSGSYGLAASDIPSLAASKITSGTFSTARIPSLAASKITSGTFADARIASAANWNTAYGWGNHASAGYSTAAGVEDNADVTDTTNVVAALTAGTNVQIAANGTISATDTNTTYSVGDGGLTQKNFTTTLKDKLDGIAASANNYSLPAGSSTVRGGFKIGYTENGKNYPVEVSSEKMYVNVPWTDNNTTYSTATSSTLGLVKIGYTENGKNYPVELSSGQMYVNVPWTDTNTTYSNATTSTDGLMSSTDKTKLNGIASNADQYVGWNFVDTSDAATRIDSQEYFKIQGATITGTGSSQDPFVVETPDTNTTYSTATSSTLGLVKIGYTENGKNYPVELSSGEMFVNVPWTDTDTNTTYSAGSGLDLSGTTFSVETDLRDGITHVGVSTNNYVTFDNTNNRIDFYAGGVHVARMESDGDLHVKGDVIAFSSIFA